MPAQITITVNGRSRTVPAGLTVGDYLKRQGLPPHRIEVRRHGLALSPAETMAAVLENGDVLEMVEIIPGG